MKIEHGIWFIESLQNQKHFDFSMFINLNYRIELFNVHAIEMENTKEFADRLFHWIWALSKSIFLWRESNEHWLLTTAINLSCNNNFTRFVVMQYFAHELSDFYIRFEGIW